MKTYNRRFAKIARRRRRIGTLGKKNKAHRCLIPGFMLKRSNMLQLFPMLASWAWLELTEGWKSWSDPDEYQPSKSPAESQAPSEPESVHVPSMEQAPGA